MWQRLCNRTSGTVALYYEEGCNSTIKIDKNTIFYIIVPYVITEPTVQQYGRTDKDFQITEPDKFDYSSRRMRISVTPFKKQPGTRIAAGAHMHYQVVDVTDADQNGSEIIIWDHEVSDEEEQ